MTEHYDPDIQAQKDYEALNAETARKLVRTAIKLKKAEARVEELEAALRKAGEEIETRPMVGRSIDYANGFRIGAQCQRLHAQSVAKQALGEKE